jgi:hypothetical protein
LQPFTTFTLLLPLLKPAVKLPLPPLACSCRASASTFPRTLPPTLLLLLPPLMALSPAPLPPMLRRRLLRLSLLRRRRKLLLLLWLVKLLV